MLNQIERLILNSLLIVTALIYIPALEAASLHAIIVADTGDQTIGDATAIDYENMQKEVRKISFYTGLSLKEKGFWGEETVPENVLNHINNLKIEEDDVVLFYFSGHGYRTPEKKVPWPNLYFSLVDQGIDYHLIGTKLESYKPRLLFVIADVCNNVIPELHAPPLAKKMLMKKLSANTIKKNYRKLFLEIKGVVMATSSKPGEISWSTEEGSLFTLAFIQSLENTVKFAKQPDWLEIFDYASTQVEGDQHPEYSLYLDAI